MEKLKEKAVQHREIGKQNKEN